MEGISLSKTYGEDAQEMKNILIMFSNRGNETEARDADIVKVGFRKSGEELRAEGMKIAEGNAEEVCPGWGDMALKAVKEFVKHNTGRFQAEDVRNWARSVPPAPSLRSWGSVMVKAARVGLIKASGYEKVNNPLAHSTPATVWIAA